MGRIATLITVNGPPGVGKSTLARRYVEAHPLTLLVEIDAIRVALGGWAEREESRQLARTLALAVIEAQLRSGHDAVVPQYLGRTAFLEALDALARRMDADLVEVLLLDTRDAVVERFRARRDELAASGRPHPQGDVDDASIDAAIDEAFDRLDTVRSARGRTTTISVAEGIDTALRTLCTLLGHGT